VSWVEKGETEAKLVTEYYRFVNRRMFGASSERSLICSIAPKNVAHINTVVSTAFRNEKKLINFIGFSHSVIFDFYLKSTGKSDLWGSTLENFPYYREQISEFASSKFNLLNYPLHRPLAILLSTQLQPRPLGQIRPAPAQRFFPATHSKLATQLRLMHRLQPPPSVS
jgi:hypothetical protein